MPAPYLNIACCVEHDSAPARLALEEARSLRGGGRARLSVVNVAEVPLIPVGFAAHMVPAPHDSPEHLREWTLGWLGQMTEGDERAVVLDGSYPPAVVCDWAGANRVDLIVAASHRGFVERVLLGSFATFLGQHAPCPVLLIRPPVAE